VEETIMSKKTNDQRAAQPPEDTQKMYARAYATRLAKQVTEEADGSRRKSTGGKKRDGRR
jgi:hypothetical protein